MIFTHIIDLHSTTAKAAITQTEDGDYIIFVNARMASNQQTKGYLHELMHIYRRDFEKEDVNDAES